MQAQFQLNAQPDLIAHNPPAIWANSGKWKSQPLSLSAIWAQISVLDAWWEGM
jgi:hypothetical protein